MQKCLIDGLLIGSAALAVGGAVACVAPDRASALLAGGAVGGLSAAVVTGYQRELQLRNELHQEVRSQVQRELDRLRDSDLALQPLPVQVRQTADPAIDPH